MTRTRGIIAGVLLIGAVAGGVLAYQAAQGNGPLPMPTSKVLSSHERAMVKLGQRVGDPSLSCGANQSQALQSYVDSFPSGASPHSPTIIPLQPGACYTDNAGLDLTGLTNATIEGNGATLNQVVPGVTLGDDTHECGAVPRLTIISASGVIVKDLTLDGAWTGTNGVTSPTATKTATAVTGDTITAGTGNVVLGDIVNDQQNESSTASQGITVTLPSTTGIAVGDAITGTGLSGSGGTGAGAWTVFKINGNVVTLSQGTTATGAPSATGTYTTDLQNQAASATTTTPAVTITFGSVTGITTGQTVTGTGLTGTWTVSAVNTSTNVVTITGGSGTPSSSGTYTFTGPTQTATAAYTSPITITLPSLTGIGVGMNVVQNGNGLTGTWTISAINTGTGVVTITGGTGAPSPLGAYQFQGIQGGWYVSAIGTGTITLAPAPSSQRWPGTGAPVVNGQYTFSDNGGQHCEAYNGVTETGNTDVILSNVTVENTQGDGFDNQLGIIPGNGNEGCQGAPGPTTCPLNLDTQITNTSTINNAGYDCVSVEGSGPPNGLTIANSTIKNCSVNMMDMEVDDGSTNFAAGSNTPYFAAQDDVVYRNDTFKNWATDFIVSPQGQCPGVQQLGVEVSGSTLINPGHGITISGTIGQKCSATTFVATTQTTTGSVNTTGLIQGDTYANIAISPGLPFDVEGPCGNCVPATPGDTVIIGSTASTTPQQTVYGHGAGAAVGDLTIPVGTNPSGPPGNVTINCGLSTGATCYPPGTLVVDQSASQGNGAARYLTSGMILANNTMVIPNPVNGFRPLFSAGPNCLPGCPNSWPIEFYGVNNLTMTNNQFYIASDSYYGPYQSAMLLQFMGGTSNIKNNNFAGAWQLFAPGGGPGNASNTGATVNHCGNTWGPTGGTQNMNGAPTTGNNDGSC